MATVPVPKETVGGAVQQYDVIIVGAGFSGISSLYRLRKDGLRAHIFESGMLWILFPFLALALTYFFSKFCVDV
jgi:hypothetical protein